MPLAYPAEVADGVLVELRAGRVELRELDTPLLHADDASVLRGDGVFESVLVRDGIATTIELHLGRLRRSADALTLPEQDLAQWRAAVELAVGEWGVAREGVLRLVLTRGRDGNGAATAFASITPVPDKTVRQRQDGISAMTLPRGQSIDLANAAPWQLLGAKTLSYATNMAALRFAQKLGTEDVIFVSTEGRVLEGPTSTVVIAQGRRLLTPPLKYGVLPGTTQRALFEVAAKAGFTCEYAPLFPADLIKSDGVWLLSGIRLAARVHTFDGLRMSAPDVATEITELVDEGVRTIGVPVPERN